MVDIQDKPRQTLSVRDHEVIRYLRFCGLSMSAIAARLGVSRYAVGQRIHDYGLDAPIGGQEAVSLELQATFYETNRRLSAPDLPDTDYARLCALQIKQGLALLRAMPDQTHPEETDMNTTTELAKKALADMSDEDLRNDIRGLAGLETKALDGCEDQGAEPETVGTCEEDPLSGTGKTGSEAAAET